MKAEVGQVTLVGTAHVSRASVDEVRATIRAARPAAVCVELDEARLAALRDPGAWAKVPVTRLIREGKTAALLAQIFLGSYQRAIGERYGVRPGEEMLAAVEEAEAVGARVVLADRDVGVTLRRAMRAMGLREKTRVAWEMTKATMGADEDDVDVDALLEEDALSAAMAELARLAPSASRVLIDERDAYLSARIRDAEAAVDGPVVAVVGAGHVKGITRHITDNTRVDTAELETVAKPAVPWGKILGWGFTLAVVGLFGWLGYRGFVTQDWSCVRQGAVAYVLSTGLLSALGAAIGGGHVLSIATAFVAAPFTVLHPALAAGWFAGAVEAWRRTPTVGDVEGLSRLRTFRDMWRNRIVRVLTVTACCNLGAMAGGFLGIAQLLGALSC